MSLNQKKIGSTIASLRKQAGFTQKGLADRLYISDKAVSKWERGLSVPDIAYLGKLSVLLDTDIDTLLEGKHVSRETCWKGFLITGEKSADVSLLTTVYDKPLVYYLLSNFLLVGIREVLIACTEAEQAGLQQLLGTGEMLGITLRYEQYGNIHRIMTKNPDFFQNCSVMTVFAPSVLYGASLTYLFQRAMLNRGQHTLLAVPTVAPAGEKKISFDETKKVTSCGAVNTHYHYCAIAVLFSPAELLIRDIRGAVEPNALIEHLTKQGSLYVENANRGILEITVNTADDALEASNLIRTLQNRSGTCLACLEEIAWRRGLIDDQALEAAQRRYSHTQYGNYLLQLSKQDM